MMDSDDDSSSVSSSSTVRSDLMSVSGTEEVHVDQDALLDKALDALDEKRYLAVGNYDVYLYKLLPFK